MKLNLVGRRFWLLGHGWVMHRWEWCQEHKYYPNTGWRQPLPGIATKLCSSCLRFIMSLHSWMSSILQKQKKHGQTCKLHPVLMGLARSHLNTWPWPLPGTYEPERQRGSWHSSLTYFNRKQRVFNTKCPLSPWLLVLLGSNLCIGIHTMDNFKCLLLSWTSENILECEPVSWEKTGVPYCTYCSNSFH